MSPSETHPLDAAGGVSSSPDDPRVVAALREYVAALEAGRRPDRRDFLGRHPEVAAELEAALDGLEFVHAAAPQLRHAEGGADPAADPAADLAPAVPLGDYQIVREVGRGGMGVVYEAVQLSLGRRVALKVLPLAAALDPRQLQRFRNEAQAAAQLNHPHIVPVHGLGCDRGVHYYAMQFVEGFTLAQVVAGLRNGMGGRPVAEVAASGSTGPVAALSTEWSARSPAFFRAVARLGRQAALALEHAHQVGVVHRDVKPSNLMLDPAGHLWVTDFGLARFRADAGLTVTGDVVGTLRYSSPEQALGKHGLVDHRSDVYSLGVTLYELLTLHPAHPGEDREGLLRHIAWGEPVAPRRLNPSLPAELETVLLKAMAREPERRYATAAELADDLGRFLEDRPVRAKRPSAGERLAKWARRHRAVVAAAAAGLVLAVAALLVSSVLLWRANERREEALRQATAQEEEARAQRQRAEENFRNALGGVNRLLWVLEEPRWYGNPEPVQKKLDEMRREVSARGLEHYQELLHPGSANPALRFETARAYEHMAGVYGQQAAFAQVLVSLGRAADLFGDLADDFPGEPDYRERQGRALYQLGIWHNSLGTHPNPDRSAEVRKEDLRQAESAFARAFEAHRRALPHDPDGHLHDRLAFELSFCPMPRMRDPAAAVALAREAVARDPRRAEYWRTLGAAFYASGDYAGAEAAVQKSMQLSPSGGNGFDWFLLAMTAWRTGDRARARRLYDRGARWMDQTPHMSDDLFRLRWEARQLLGLPEPEPPDKDRGKAGKK
jgi:serine/threonine protein kinase